MMGKSIYRVVAGSYIADSNYMFLLIKLELFVFHLVHNLLTLEFECFATKMKCFSDIRRKTCDFFADKSNRLRSDDADLFQSALQDLFDLLTRVWLIDKSSIADSAGDFRKEFFWQVHCIGDSNHNQL